MARRPDCTFVPLYTTRIVSYVLSIVFGAIAVASAFHAKEESHKTKGSAQAAVQKLTPGVKLTIDTSDVYTAGVVEGIAQMGLVLLSLGCIGLLLFDSKKRYAVPNAPHVRSTPWSTKTLILQVLCYVIATAFCIATAVTTTLFVATRSAKVSSILPNGTPMAQSLIDSFQGKLGISPVYSKQDYLVFLAVAPWAGVLFSIVSLIVSIVAWRRYVAASAASQRSNSFDSAERNSIEKY